MKEITSSELRSMSREQVEMKIEELRQELFKLRLQSTTSFVKSYPSDRTKLKRSIARALTMLKSVKE